MKLSLKVINVEDNTREALMSTLMAFGEEDWDFMGYNGMEYLPYRVWKINGFEDMSDWEAKGKPAVKYESHASYLCDRVSSIESDTECIDTFFKEWFYYDGYYEEYDYDIITNKDDEIIAIALAFTFGS